MWGQPKLLTLVRNELRRRHYSPSTERLYIYWLKQYFYFHKLQHPATLNGQHITQFLNHLTLNRKVSASTQTQALNAVIFLYKQILKVEIEDLSDLVRPKRFEYLPVVLSQEEVRSILSSMSGQAHLATSLLYGTGMRISECITLRVQDIDLSNRSICIRNTKGRRARVTLLPEKLVPALSQHLVWRKQLHVNDLNKGWGHVPLPNALHRKYPKANTRFEWQFVFASATVNKDKDNQDVICRWHMSKSTVSKAVRKAVNATTITKRVTAHTFRHSFATHLLQAGTDIRTIQQLMGHKDLKTTMLYTHIAAEHCKGTKSPFDRLFDD